MGACDTRACPSHRTYGDDDNDDTSLRHNDIRARVHAHVKIKGVSALGVVHVRNSTYTNARVLFANKVLLLCTENAYCEYDLLEN